MSIQLALVTVVQLIKSGFEFPEQCRVPATELPFDVGEYSAEVFFGAQVVFGLKGVAILCLNAGHRTEMYIIAIKTIEEIKRSQTLTYILILI